jgi:ATP-dependent helicase HepA
LNPQGITSDAFPAMPAEGIVVTRDRQRALSREDVGFLTWDHPMVTGALDLLLGSETGNCAFAVLPAPRERTLLLECCFVLECVAAPRLHVDRFLPTTPIRLVVNHALENVTELHSDPAFSRGLRKGSPQRLIDNPELTRRTLPAMLEQAATLAEVQARVLRQSAQDEMNHLLGHEVQRLQTLRQVNDHIRPEEIELATAQQAELAAALRQARVRLEAVRFIWKGPPEALG